MVADKLDVWERRLGVLANLIPYLALLLPTLMYLVLVPDPPEQRLVTLSIVAGAVAWMLWWHTLHPAWRARSGLMVVFFLGVLVFYAVLGLDDPIFGFYSFAGYVYAIDCLHGRMKFVGVLINALIASASLYGGFPSTEPLAIFTYVVITFFIVMVAMTFTTLGFITAEQSRRRKEMVAEMAAMMEENAGLHAQLLIQAREAGVLDERQRLAGEIHDTLAQGFTGIITQLQAVDEPSRRVDTALRLARENLAEARRSVHALRPPALEDANLPDALVEVASGWTDQTGVPASVATTGAARPLHPEVEVALLRTAQEALSNVAKHASASRVGLTLSYMEDVVTLDVRDDGTGFDPGRETEGYGLVGMRQRVSRLAGALAVESEPGAGTAVSASVPAIPAEVAR
ncbi:sensor histidine kinase [Actinosynnema sp. NPDC047251]|uniref:Putative histidine kinase n=1 Tax=Saccharothrix espanaensis (strain ATCC 51144 / DSM 44229 / JCM 9112 / NBRC 15066 / NRRL 15764) TaxID=1179773 RepID=K0JW84_SACES|nr:sensor histidine kinase [Saccharothrix espanaensis]CCH30301.1 putative histidine kinase [Saccharothrix espanaensis DSM 44229]